MARDNDRLSVASTGGPIPHQPARAQSSLSSLTSLLQVAASDPKTCPYTNGQYHGCGVCQQERGYVITQPVSASAGLVGSGARNWFLDLLHNTSLEHPTV